MKLETSSPCLRRPLRALLFSLLLTAWAPWANALNGVQLPEPQRPDLASWGAGRDRMALGLGMEQRWRTSTGVLAGSAAEAVTADNPEMRVSLVLTRSDPYRALLRGTLMRVELTGQTALSLKTRGSRVGVALSSQW